MAQPTWVTPAGNIGTYTEGTPISIALLVNPSTFGYTLEYTLLNGVFPDAIVPFNLNSISGILTGVPAQVAETTDFYFTVRVYQYDGATQAGFTDRTFSFTVEGVTPPTFITPTGPLYPGPTFLPDSTWNPYQIVYTNPDPSTTATVRVVDGSLPPGLEMNETGLMRGYADPSSSNFSFTLEVSSESGSSTEDYSIQIDQLTPLTRIPAILNTRPPSFTIPDTDPNAPYYLDSTGNLGTLSQDNYFIFKIIGESFDAGALSYTFAGTLPPGVTSNENYGAGNVLVTVLNGGINYAPGDQLYIFGGDLGGANGTNNLFFTVTSESGGVLTAVGSYSGWNVDSGDLYAPVNIQTLTGVGTGATARVQKVDPSWITGTIAVNPGLEVATYNFSCTAFNTVNGLTSASADFVVTVVAQNGNVPLSTEVTWVTGDNLGTIFNGEVSNLAVQATSASDFQLDYSITSGSLPQGLSLSSNGDIVGRVAFETAASVTPLGTSTEYTFTVLAQNPTYSEVASSRTFTLTVYQNFDQPYDNIYIKAYLPVDERLILDSLLQDTYIFNPDYIYRPNDPYFGLSTGITYQHMFGVPASTVADYIAAVDLNHYRRNIVLGPVKTAVARDQNGTIQYEVVYSEIIDDLVNAQGISINKEVFWPVAIPDHGRTLYPASLPNMRTQIVEALGQENQASLLPTWMRSQQADGNIPGFIPAWVICYTKPGYSEIVKNNILSPLDGPVTVTATLAADNSITCTSTALFYEGMKVVFSGTAFGGITAGVEYYVYNILSETSFQIATSMIVGPTPLSTATGVMELTHVTWSYTLNYFDFRIDRFEVSKAITFDYDPTTETWSALPSGVDSTDSNDFYVYFNKDILSST